ncbi:ANTAR domain-containing response regulator [Undibacterium luofuense]|uniref:Response regulator n=1 Tax=Undibacterium luofuense TaxID=2828733 RepID=A0A941DU71_9BURK|nr:response regulator [Undibacterium luofuense]MBR7784126.1 response regulator [Undibacterium luofuense]
MLKAVILDGNAIARNLLTSVLTSGGHEVVGDSNIAPASLTKMVRLRPQIVCIDIGDANDEGFALIDQLRKDLPKSLIFLVSSKIDANTLQTAQQRGVHGFIVKPFNSVAVLSSIRNTIIRIAKQQRAAQEAATPSSESSGTESSAG